MSEKTREKYDFSKLKVNGGKLNNPVYIEGQLQKNNKNIANKAKVLEAIERNNYVEMVQISDHFYKTSGIYNRLCRYLAYLYKYDWMITPYFDKKTPEEENSLLTKFYNALNYFDNFNVKKFCGNTALKVVRRGCFYGYWSDLGDRPIIQELPANYCRSRFKTADGRPAVEFYAKFFDDRFKSTQERKQIFEIFPPEFEKNYKKFKAGKLPPQFQGDQAGWFLLNPDHAIKFNLNEEDFPTFISVIPDLLDLDDMQELERKKAEQQLLKIIVQKFPLDKNYDLVFDVDEMAELHAAASKMIGDAIGLNVLTTVADIDVEDVADKKSDAVNDIIEKSENAVFNGAGVSQMQFNTSGNLALEKSILNDEASMVNLIQQFEDFLNLIVRVKFNKKSKAKLRVQVLNSTIYNYKELSKQAKEMTQLGYSKQLPQIILGQSQSAILATSYFENQVLDLVNQFIPPMSSNTMNADALKTEESKSGRPTKESKGESLTDKSIANRESEN